ncbi:MAG: MOP flippase family protein [Anaerolineae bacterium]|nr:MOP flippase family protein [Anaerolineae bacterium]
MSLTKASAKGVFWINADRVMGQILGLISTAILARLLIPADFGLVAMANLVTNLMNLITELGLAEAIIQREELEERHKSTAFWVNMISGCVLACVTVLTAPLAAWFFESPDLQPILSVLSLSFVFGTFGSVQEALFIRRMQFQVVAMARISYTVIRVVITIILALAGLGVWSLVIGNLAGTLTGSGLMWIFSSWRPKLILSRDGLGELLRFSLNLVGARVMGYFGNKIADILVGKFLGPAALGVYSIASNITWVLRAQLATSVTEATFPAFASIQQDDERLRRGYIKLVKYISLVTFPAMVGLIIVAPEFVQIVYGSKWQEVVLPLQILCFGAAFSTLGIINGPIQKAKGRTNLHLNLVSTSVVLSVIFTIIGANYGLVGVSIAIAVRSLLWMWIAAFFTYALINLSFKPVIKALYPATLGSLTMGGVAIVYRFYAVQLLSLNDLTMLTTTTLVGIGVYLSTLKIFDKSSLDEGYRLFVDILKPYFLTIQKRIFFFRAQ